MESPLKLPALLTLETLRIESLSLSSIFTTASRPPPTPSFELVSGLGKGGYAIVVLVRVRQANEDQGRFAMKVISKGMIATGASSKKQQEKLRTELSIMRDIAPSSRFLENCHTAFESSTNVFFVCDYIAGGDLFYHMSRRMDQGHFGFELDECRILLAELFMGVQHLHAHDFIHRDLKVENIMLDASGHVKLIDFGIACCIPNDGLEQSMSVSGSLIYMAPKLIRFRKGGRHTDWWSFGVVAFELMTGRSPWSSLTDRQIIRDEIVSCLVSPPDWVPASAEQLLKGLLSRNWRTRLGTRKDQELSDSRFLEGTDLSAMERGMTPPAFVCGPADILPDVSGNAVKSYKSMAAAAEGASEETGRTERPRPWFLGGIEVVESNPIIVSP